MPRIDLEEEEISAIVEIILNSAIKGIGILTVADVLHKLQPHCRTPMRVKDLKK